MSTESPPRPARLAPITPPRVTGKGVLAALVLLYVAAPFLDSVQGGQIVESVLISLVLCATVFAVGGHRRTFATALALAAPAVAGKWIDVLSPGLLPPEIFRGAAILTLAFITLQFLRLILFARRVDSHVLCAGLAAFFLLALVWTFAYALVGNLAPGSFVYTVTPGAPGRMTGFTALYFSLVTLCTVGYGDIVPASNPARMLAMLEGATGVIYIAVVISRLVSLYTAESLSRQAEDAHSPPP